MTQMRLTNIPYLLELSNNSMYNTTLFGVLVPDVQKPPHFEYIQTNRKATDAFALIDLVGIDILGKRSFAKGQVLAVVDKSLIEAARKKPSGRLSIILAGGSLKLDTSQSDDLVSYAKWVKGPSNAWQVTSVPAAILTKKDHPEYFDLIKRGYKDNWVFPYPEHPEASYRPASQGYDYLLENGSYFNKTKGQTPEHGMQEAYRVASQASSLPTPTEQPKQPKPKQPVYEAPPEYFGGNHIRGTNNPSMGNSSQSNISDLNQNMLQANENTNHSSRDKVRGREKVLEPTENFKYMNNQVDEATLQVEKVLDHLVKLSGEDLEVETVSQNGVDNRLEVSKKLNDAIQLTQQKLAESWERKRGEYTGRALFKESCERVLLEKFSTKDTTGSSPLDLLLTVLQEGVLEAFLGQTINVGGDTKLEELVRDITYQRYSIYFQMVDILLGTGSKLTNLNQLAPEGVSVLHLLETNPYMLCFIDPRLDVETLDKLAMYGGINFDDPSIIRTRNVAFMHNYMLDSNNRIIQDNTIVSYHLLLSNIRAGFLISKSAYSFLQADGTLIKIGNIETLQYYLNPSISPNNFALKKDGWVKAGGQFLMEIKGLSTEGMLRDYIKSGMGIELNLNNKRFVSSYIYAKKEMYIYTRMYELSKMRGNQPTLTDEDIRKCRESFEKMKTEEYNLPKDNPFKLEVRQAESLNLLREPVICLTGPAGSGKTTTAEALVFGAETLLGFYESQIAFAAPTGRAANRLKEIVKRKTRTINSLFNIGGDSVQVRDPEKVQKFKDIKLFVFDETSMPNINLLYDMLIHIEDGTHLYFLGDIEQLPPIGFGKPFANMLQFLPTVVLNVTKRASDASGITFNSKRIIYESDGIIQDLEERDDFRIIDTRDVNEAVNKILDICSYHIGKGSNNGFQPVTNMGTDLSPDDIQVITPINGKEWGTKALNKALQNIFNPVKPREMHISFARTKDDIVNFRKGDRVVHTLANQKDRPRLILMDSGKFKEDNENTGIANGDQGKILGFYKPSKLEFEGVDEKDEAQIKQKYQGEDEKTLYVAVMFKDMDALTGKQYEFVILYRASITLEAGYLINVTSRDLFNLDLAYALTTHKLQGSEAPLVLCVFFKAGPKGFISRNMLYTALSRARKAEYYLGDILGRQSIVNQGRKYEQTKMRNSVLDQF